MAMEVRMRGELVPQIMSKLPHRAAILGATVFCSTPWTNVQIADGASPEGTEIGPNAPEIGPNAPEIVRSALMKRLQRNPRDVPKLARKYSSEQTKKTGRKASQRTVLECRVQYRAWWPGPG